MRDDVITLISAASSGWCGAKKEKLYILKMTPPKKIQLQQWKACYNDATGRRVVFESLWIISLCPDSPSPVSPVPPDRNVSCWGSSVKQNHFVWQLFVLSCITDPTTTTTAITSCFTCTLTTVLKCVCESVCMCKFHFLTQSKCL